MYAVVGITVLVLVSTGDLQKEKPMYSSAQTAKSYLYSLDLFVLLCQICSCWPEAVFGNVDVMSNVVCREWKCLITEVK